MNGPHERILFCMHDNCIKTAEQRNGKWVWSQYPDRYRAISRGKFRNAQMGPKCPVHGPCNAKTDAELRLVT